MSTRLGRVTVPGAALLLAVSVLSGCGPLAAKADCTPEVKYDDQVYRQAGFSFEHGDEVGEADLAWCEDVGRDARGNVFDETSTSVTVYEFPGFDPEDVVVHSVSGDLFTVLISTDLADDEAEKIRGSELMNGNG